MLNAMLALPPSATMPKIGLMRGWRRSTLHDRRRRFVSRAAVHLTGLGHGLAVRALVDAGVPRNDKRLVGAATWLLDKQIVATYGDWS